MRRTTVAESGFYIAARERNTFRRANWEGLPAGKVSGSWGDLNNTNTAPKITGCAGQCQAGGRKPVGKLKTRSDSRPVVSASPSLCPSAGRLFIQELAENGHEGFGLLNMGQVPAIGDQLEEALPEVGDRCLRLGIGKHSVTVSPNEECRHLQIGKLIYQHLPLPSQVDLSTQGGLRRLHEVRQLRYSG